MKALVLGATGMAGHVISIYLCEAGHDMTAFSRASFPYCKSIQGDALDFPFLEKLILKGQFDVVINAIGVLNHFAENRPTAVLLNSFLPHFLSKITEGSSTKIIHMSTDCVFSGKTGNYDEKSLRDGETFYDRTKALGELDNTKDLTFRNSIIGPDINENGIGLFHWFMKQKGPIQGYSKVIWTGVTTLTLAKAMEQAVLENLTGLYHLVHHSSINKYDLLQLFNTAMKNGAIDILPSETLQIDKTLINTRTDFSFSVPDYDQMIQEQKEWILQHKNLYPFYNL